jgi:DNA mismatch repair protein MutS
MSRKKYDFLSYADVDRSLMQSSVKAYCKAKDENPGCIVLLRVGDYYEAMFEDAILVADLLELVLTAKKCGDSLKIYPLVGVPYHVIDRYVAFLREVGNQVVVL